jgi:ubiquinone/menaquinone biosynthesis C-methylase UbiE
MPETDVELVAAGYDVVYAGISHSPTFAKLWREHSLGDEYPVGFEHISFLTLSEMRQMAQELRLIVDGELLDLASGMGGPGLWVAKETGARLIGVDVSAVALEHARKRAGHAGMSGRAEFLRGTFAATGLEGSSVDSVMTVDALQYAPDKRAAIEEVARVLRPGGRFVFACFEVEPSRVQNVPVFGTDPVGDYRPLLADVGFDVLRYEESIKWERRVTSTYQAIIDAKDTLIPEIGEAAFSALLGEVSVTLQLRPYRSRVLVAAEKH